MKEHKMPLPIIHLCDQFLGRLWNGHVGSLAKGEKEDDKDYKTILSCICHGK